MAPKRKKKGQTRMDAAVDQMGRLGFDGPYVRKTVRNLLKVYGEDNWMMIEDCAYKVLVDFILDEQEQAAKKHSLLMDASSSEVAAKDASLQGKAIASPTHIAESNDVPPVTIEGQENQGCSKDVDLVDKNNLRSSPLHAHSVNETNLQDTENTSLSLIACNAVHAPVNAYARKCKPCFGWISDDEEDDDTKFLEPAPAT